MDDSEYSGPAAHQDLEGYHRDPGFGRNSERDSGKCKNSWRAMEIDCDSGRGIRRTLARERRRYSGYRLQKLVKREQECGLTEPPSWPWPMRILSRQSAFYWNKAAKRKSSDCSRVKSIQQGHATTVSFKIHWKHFKGYPEYFKISRNTF